MEQKSIAQIRDLAILKPKLKLNHMPRLMQWRWPPLHNRRMKLSKQLDNQITYLGFYQMIGGVIGIVLNNWLLINTGYITGAAVFLLFVSYGLFGFSIYCGNLLHKSEYDKGLSLSKINQALQVIKFSILGYGYKYISGFILMIGFDITNNFQFTFEFSLSS